MCIRDRTGAARAQVDKVLYVPAALALHQRPAVPGIRSTFGTGTELLNSPVSYTHLAILQLVRAQLVDATDPAALLAHLEQNPAALCVDLPHCCGKLLPAVATLGTERVTGQTFRMDTTEQIFTVADVALDQRDMMLAVQLVSYTHLHFTS